MKGEGQGTTLFLAYVIRICAVLLAFLLAIAVFFGVLYLNDVYIKPKAMAAEACIVIKKERALEGETFDCKEYLGL